MKNELLYFHDIAGAGTIICNDCNCREDIISFIHGAVTSDTGLQCQLCGAFHAIKDWDSEKEPMDCHCGGTLKREEPLFCPRCKSNLVRYSMRYIT